MLLLHPYLLSWSPDLPRRLTGAGSLEVKVGIAPTAFCVDTILYIPAHDEGCDVVNGTRQSDAAVNRTTGETHCFVRTVLRNFSRPTNCRPTVVGRVTFKSSATSFPVHHLWIHLWSGCGSCGRRRRHKLQSTSPLSFLSLWTKAWSLELELRRLAHCIVASSCGCQSRHRATQWITESLWRYTVCQQRSHNAVCLIQKQGGNRRWYSVAFQTELYSNSWGEKWSADLNIIVFYWILCIQWW